MNKKALIIVDVQNDFCKGGSLYVPNGDDIVEGINQLMLKEKYSHVIATLDWHPKNHSSFISNNSKTGIWPDHCIQNSTGAAIHKNLNTNYIEYFIRKGTNPEVDSYSGFFDNDKKSQTGLHQLLQNLKIQELDVVGLALDYCVKATALDAVRLGYKTTVLKDLTKAVNIKETDYEDSIKELKQNNVFIK